MCWLLEMGSLIWFRQEEIGAAVQGSVTVRKSSRVSSSLWSHLTLSMG